jgi:peptidoglycan/xylan/chitin deacetylase (PgdA/CDA1 family)
MAVPLLAVIVLLAGCGAPARTQRTVTPPARTAAVTRAARARAAAESFMRQMEAGRYQAQWSELAPLAQAQWPSEAARTAMLAAKFRGPAKIVSFTLGAAQPAPDWVSPENPSQRVAGGLEVPATVTFADPAALRPTGLLTAYQQQRLVILAPRHGPAQVVGEGPASLDAPVIEPTALPREVGAVPVLMYHVVAPFPNRSQWNSQYAYDLEYGLTVTPGQFADQMAYLAFVHAHAISLNRLADFLLYGLPLPARPVVITFDDGRESPYLNAVPVLARYGFTATFFVPSGMVGKFVRTLAGTNPQHYMSWSQIDTLASSGYWIEDHTLYDNVALWGLPAAEVAQLAGQTAATLARHTGRPVQFIAYSGLWPYPTSTGVGPSQTELFSELEQLGYVGGAVDARTDSDTQTTAGIWQIPRVRINPNEAGSQLSPWFQ